MCDLASMFGGPSPSEKQIEGQTQSFGQVLQGNYNTEFANENQTLANLQTQIGREESGNMGPGWGTAENAAITSNIINQGAAAAANAEQRAQDVGAGQVFGGIGSTSGLNRGSAITGQRNAAIASAAATSTANQLNAATIKNYEQGVLNTQQSIAGLGALAGHQGALAGGAMSGSLSADQQAFGEAKTIQEQRAQETQGILKAVESGVGVLAGGVAGGLGAGGGFLDTLKGVAGGAMGDTGMFLQNPSGGGGGGGMDFSGAYNAPLNPATFNSGSYGSNAGAAPDMNSGLASVSFPTF